ncbi:hypothetical protein BKA69DRAFT_1082921, partial [Paraphysoderma sedebokerense]
MLLNNIILGPPVYFPKLSIEQPIPSSSNETFAHKHPICYLEPVPAANLRSESTPLTGSV